MVTTNNKMVEGKTFFERLTRLVEELNCPKSRYNAFGDYHHRSLEDIFNGIKQLMTKYQIYFSVSDELINPVEGVYFIKATATAINAVQPEQTISSVAYAMIDFSRKKMDASQATGAASSYARKYALGALLCLDDVKDADAQVPIGVSDNAVADKSGADDKPSIAANKSGEADKPSEAEVSNNGAAYKPKLVRTKTHYELKLPSGEVMRVDVNDSEGYNNLLKTLKSLKS